MIERLLMFPLGITLLTALASAACAQDTEITRPTLRGLRGVEVLVEDFDENSKRAGYDKRTFQTDLELQLRMAGIKVLTVDETLALPGRPYLYLNVHSLARQPGEIAAVAVELALNQGVWLRRDPSVQSIASTWSSTGVAQADLSHVRDFVKELTDDFTNAWLSVNPKK